MKKFDLVIVKEQVEKSLKVQYGKLEFDSKEISSIVSEIKNKFKGIEFSDSQELECEELNKSLEQVVKYIDRVRIDTVKDFKTPVEVFEETLKKLNLEVKETLKDIKEQVVVFKQKKRDIKSDEITDIYNVICEESGGNFPLVSNEKWFNKTFKMKDVKIEIQKMCDEHIEFTKREEQEKKLKLELRKVFEMKFNELTEKYNLKEKLLFLEVEECLEFGVVDGIETMEEIFKNRLDNQNKFEEAQAKKELDEIKVEKKEFVKEDKMKSYLINFNLNVKQAKMMLEFFNNNNIDFEVVK